MGKNYNTINSLKSCFTIYRNYLKNNIDVKVEKKRVNLLDTVLSILRLTNEQQKEFISNQNANIKKDKSNLRLIYNIDNYLSKSISLLSSPHLYDNLIGLAAVTGRRIAEIACSAKFIIILSNLDFFCFFAGRFLIATTGRSYFSTDIFSRQTEKC